MTDGTIQEQVMARAMKDQTFRHELLNNPRAVLAREYQVHLPESITVRVLEDAPNTLTLVLPRGEGAMLELSDAELEAVSGWGMGMTTGASTGGGGLYD